MAERIESDPLPRAGEAERPKRWWLPSKAMWAWIGLNLIVGSYFAHGFFSESASTKVAWLPGETTHGHYQIELKCNACHGPVDSSTGVHSSENVMTDACNKCHADQLKLAKDTHPAKKFNDPVNAELLEVLNAQDCLACHREHVPEQTLEMGLTMPADYCWHCHEDVSGSRPSHEGMAFDSCATAGCHNYHDNRALYEKFLNDHFGEPDFKDEAVVLMRRLLAEDQSEATDSVALEKQDADAPDMGDVAPEILNDWAFTAHASAGVNCSGCHQPDPQQDTWTDTVTMDRCESCHESQTESFVRGRHGMRLAEGLSPMTPSMARLPMHPDVTLAGNAHAELTCNACHSGHRFDTQFAAVDACKQCHSDAHTLAYDSTAHADLWAAEIAGTGPQGSGVSCATCHLPRLEDDNGDVWVNHNQNDNLRPNETMARQVCMNCHGLEYSLSALAEPSQSETCYGSPVEGRTESVQMAHDWFAAQEAKRAARQRKRSP